MNLLELRDVSRTWTSHGLTTVGLDGVSLAVQPGERVGIVGGSGSGKTTMIRLLTALDRPSTGQVFFDGLELGRARGRALADLRSRVQIVFQDPRSSLDPRMRVRDIVAEPLLSPLLRGRPDVPRDRAGRVEEVLAQVGLDRTFGARYPHELSGGQRQRVAIGRALAPLPDVLVADEPVSALDVSVRAQVLNLVMSLVASQNLTLILVSHDLAVVRHLCERVVVVARGRIVEEGVMEQVWSDPHHAVTRELLAARPRLPRP